MSDIIVKKDGTDYPLQTMPLHYPADRVYLNGDTSKTVQDYTVKYMDKTVTFDSSNVFNMNDYPANCYPIGAIDIGNDWDFYIVGYQVGQHVWRIKNLATSTAQTRTVRIFYVKI